MKKRLGSKKQLVKEKVLTQLKNELIKLQYETGQKNTIINYVDWYIDKFLTEYNKK